MSAVQPIDAPTPAAASCVQAGSARGSPSMTVASVPMPTIATLGPPGRSGADRWANN